jgi:hypothetical protein
MTLACIDARAWLADAAANRSFTVPLSAEPPPAQLDGEEIDVRSMLYAAVVVLAPTPDPLFELPRDVSYNDYQRCCRVVEGLIA